MASSCHPGPGAGRMAHAAQNIADNRTVTQSGDVGARLEQRYGRPRSPTPRRWYWIGGGVAVLLFSAGAAGVALTSSDFVADASVETFVAGDTSLGLTVTIAADPNSTPRCEVQALGADKQVVGFIERDFPMNGRATQRVILTIQTVEPAVTGLIGQCRLT